MTFAFDDVDEALFGQIPSGSTPFRLTAVVTDPSLAGTGLVAVPRHWISPRPLACAIAPLAMPTAKAPSLSQPHSASS